MRFDAALIPADLACSGELARGFEARGFDGVATFDGPHDAFLPLAQAAQATQRLELMTGVAIAFARNPMVCAYMANDLQLMARGRFHLGLGTQIRPHIERRFSETWSRPNERMREFVLALRAIWLAWASGARLDFQGEMYQHTLMTPFLSPGPNPYGPPPVLLAGFGPSMIGIAAEVGDGWIVHPLHSPEFVRQVARPALEAGWRRARRSREGFTIAAQTIVMLGSNDAEIARARAAAKAQIAFYGSTPAYRVFLDFHGWGELQPRWRELSRQGQWAEMVQLVSDDMLDTIGVSGTPTQAGRQLRQRCSFADRAALILYNETDPEAVVDLLAAAREP